LAHYGVRASATPSLYFNTAQSVAQLFLVLHPSLELRRESFISSLLDDDFGAAAFSAAKAFDLAFFESYNSVFGGVNREVPRYKSAGTGAFSGADLADNNITDVHSLAAPYLNPQPLAGTISCIFAGTASFGFTHLSALLSLNN
jgi:hypothetical protein